MTSWLSDHSLSPSGRQEVKYSCCLIWMQGRTKTWVLCNLELHLANWWSKHDSWLHRCTYQVKKCKCVFGCSIHHKWLSCFACCEYINTLSYWSTLSVHPHKLIRKYVIYQHLPPKAVRVFSHLVTLLLITMITTTEASDATTHWLYSS